MGGSGKKEKILAEISIFLCSSLLGTFQHAKFDAQPPRQQRDERTRNLDTHLISDGKQVARIGKYAVVREDDVRPPLGRFDKPAKHRIGFSVWGLGFGVA
jgi:hypothetical protein